MFTCLKAILLSLFVKCRFMNFYSLIVKCGCESHFYPDFSKKISAYRLENLSGRASVQRRKQFVLKFRFPLITFSLVNQFTSYTHTLLLRS